MNDIANAAPDSSSSSAGAVTVVAPGALTAEAPHRILSEALAQLQRLGDLREEELKRHELVVADMQASVRRNARFSGLLLALCLVILAALVALGVVTHHLRRDQVATRTGIAAATARVTEVSGLLQEATVQSTRKLDGVQAGLAANTRRMEAVLGGISTTVDDSLKAVRLERDQVQTGVKLAIEDHNRKVIEKEVALRQEELRIRQEAEKAKQDRLRVIRETIEKLSSMAAENKPAPPAATAP